jgi:predicted nucleotidyltransferase
MAKITNPGDIFPDIIESYKGVYGDDLISIILYGSAAGDDYNPGRSDLNFLIVLSEAAIDHLDRAIGIVSRWKKKNVAVPLFMTRSYIASSLDSYPIEFLNMQMKYILVYGEDVLKDVSIKSDHVRLQCEREIKGKLLLLRAGFLQTEGKKRKIKELISSSITAFVSIFSGILYIRNVGIPGTRRKILSAVAKEIPVNMSIFTECMDVKEDKRNFSSAEINTLFKDYLCEIRKLWEFVDKMEVEDFIT